MLIKNCCLIDMAGLWMEPRDIRVNGPKITEIAPRLEAEAGEAVFDAQGKIVTPGFVDLISLVGVNSQIHRIEASNANESTDPVQPQLRALDAIDMADEGFKMACQGGITTSLTGPGTENLIGGTAALFKSGGASFAARLVQAEAAYRFSLNGEPRAAYGGKNQAPKTRMATAAMVRGQLAKAQEYHRVKSTGGTPPADANAAALSRLFDGMPVKIAASQQADIRMAIRICQEFGLAGIIDIAFEAADMPEEIKAAGLPLCVGPLYGGNNGLDSKGRSFDIAKRLEAQGISFALATGHPGLNAALTMVQAGLVCRHGASRQAVLQAMTINAARMIGMADRLGSIEAQKDADIVVWDGQPWDYYGRVDMLFIDGLPIDPQTQRPM